MKKQRGKDEKLGPAYSLEESRTITRRIYRLMAERGIKNRRQLALQSGVDNSIIYKITDESPDANGHIRLWNLDHLHKIAAVLQVEIEKLTGESKDAPVVAEIIGGAGSLPENVDNSDKLGYYRFNFAKQKDVMESVYALPVKDGSLLPVFRPGSILVAQKNTFETIREADYVVYTSPEDQLLIRQIFFDGSHIILKSLTQGVPDTILPRRLITSCDRILRVDFSPAA
jgi:hypothetical protein